MLWEAATEKHSGDAPGEGAEGGPEEQVTVKPRRKDEEGWPGGRGQERGFPRGDA